MLSPSNDTDDEDFRGLLLRFRGRTRLSQTQLAMRAGVHLRSVQAWESGVSFPVAERLQSLITSLLAAGGFTVGGEAAEAEALWSAANRESPRQRPPFDARWFAEVLATRDMEVTVETVAPTPPAGGVHGANGSGGARAQDWGDAPDTLGFLGRRAELDTLRAWVIHDRARLLVLSGMGGIGKTTLAARLAREVAPEFERMYWRSVRDAPLFTEWSGGAIGFLSDQQRMSPGTADAARAEMLLELMRARRCLVVIDNLEVLLQSGHHDGSFRPEYDGYAMLFRAVGERKHQSCVLLTSREVPSAYAQSGTCVLELGGLTTTEAKQLLSEMRLHGDEPAWTQLVSRYGGNGLALRVVGDAIRQVFGGDIAEFMEQVPSGTVFGGIRRLLESQYDRLSPVELEILQLLAVAREPVSFLAICSELTPHASRSDVLEAIEALRHRSLIEPGGTGVGFTLQSVVLEYVTDQLVERGATEVAQGQLNLLVRRPLLKAQAKDYVRRAQEMLIAQVLLERLVASVGGFKAAAEDCLLRLLDQARERRPEEQGYGPGNVINLLRLLRGNLRGINLSGLSIRQAYLQEIEAQDANLAGARLTETVLGDSFGAVGSVAISASAERIAAGTLGGAVRVWRMVDRAPQLSARGHVGAIWGVALSADGRLLASGSLDGGVRLWDVDAGKVATLAQEQSGGVARVVLSADGRLLGAGGLDGTVRLFDARAGQPLRTLEGHSGAVYGMAISDDGRLLASSGLDGTVRLWEVESGRPLMKLLGHDGAAWGVALSANGEIVVSGGQDGTVRLWERYNGRPLATLAGHVGAVRGVALSADGRTVASGGFDGTVRLWEVRGGRRLATLQGHTGGVRGVALSADGRTVVSGGFDGIVRLWDAHGGLPLATLQGHTHGVRGVALSADGRTLAASGPDATIRLWEPRSGRLLAELEGHSGGVRGVALSADARVLASCGLDRTVRVWDAERSRPLAVLEGHTAAALAVAISPDGGTIASGSLDGTVRLWDQQSHQCVAILEGHSGAVWKVALSPDRRTVASCGLDGTARLWDLGDNRTRLTLRGHRGGVRSVSISADSGTVFSSGDDGTVRVWDAQSGRCLAVLEGHTAAVYDVAPGRDARTVASGSVDGTVRLWDTRSRQCLAVLEGHTDAVYDVALSADGRMVASGSLDATLKLWDTTSFSLLRTLRPDRRYERMDITGLTGVTDAQRATLIALGAIDNTTPYVGRAPVSVFRAA